MLEVVDLSCPSCSTGAGLGKGVSEHACLPVRVLFLQMAQPIGACR